MVKQHRKDVALGTRKTKPGCTAITLNNMPEDLHAALKARAARESLSARAMALIILREGLKEDL